MKNSKINIIESAANLKIKAVMKLRERSFRDDSGLMLIDGNREIGLALKNNFKLEEVYYCQEYIKDSDNELLLGRITDLGVTMFKVSPAVFERIAFGSRKEGFLAIAKQIKRGLVGLEIRPNSIFVVLEGVEKPGNLGAVMRTCEAAGIEGLIVCDGRTDIYNPNCIRSSIGACFSLPIAEASFVPTLKWLKGNKIKIIAAVPEAKVNYWDIDLQTPCALVFGAEDKGLSDIFKQESDFKLGIPMQGQVDSLNLSISAAVIIYEALRQRDLKSKI